MTRLGAAIVSLVLSACSGGADAELPERYRDLDVPTDRLASAEARERGRAVYLERCALCHGVDADGHGVRRQALSAPPADFRSRVWRRGVSPRSVFRVIREGVPGSSMPAWPVLDDGQTWDVVAYVLGVAEDGP